MRNIISLSAGVGLVSILALFFVFGLTDIDPGETGLKVKKIGIGQGMQDDTLDTGLHWINPVTYDVPIYDVRFRQYVLKDVETQTKDGQPVLIDVSLEMGLQPDRVPWIHENIGPDYWEEVVFPALRSAIRDKVPSKLSDEIYTSEGREGVQQAIQTILDNKLKERGFLITVNLRDIDFTNAQFVATLEEKAMAAQKVIIEERKAEAAENTAVKIANIAEGEKQKRIKEAEAEREKRRLEGEGERLKQEEIAKGILAVKSAEAEGARLLTNAYTGPGAQYVAAIEWAQNLGPNVKVYGVPTGAPGTNSLMDLNGVLENAFKISR